MAWKYHYETCISENPKVHVHVCLRRTLSAKRVWSTYWCFHSPVKGVGWRRMKQKLVERVWEVLQNVKGVCFPGEDYFGVQILILLCDLLENSQYPAVTEEMENICQVCPLRKVTFPGRLVKLRAVPKVCSLGEEPPWSLVSFFSVCPLEK